MSDRITAIQTAIDSFQMDRARELLRDELQENPSPEVYFLASQAAVNHGQRVKFLEKTLDLDPFHQAAHDELAMIVPPGMKSRTVPETFPQRKPKAKNTVTYPLTSIGKRFVALLLDSIILAVIGGVFGAIYGGLFGPDLAGYDIYDQAYIEAFAEFQLSAMMLGLLINAVYHIYFMTRNNGQTPGKKVLGIRAVKKDGTPFTFIDALLRNVIGYALSSILILGYIWAFIDSEKQGWHDKITGTVVVDESIALQS